MSSNFVAIKFEMHVMAKIIVANLAKNHPFWLVCFRLILRFDKPFAKFRQIHMFVVLLLLGISEMWP